MKQQTRYSHFLKSLIVFGDYIVLNITFVFVFLFFSSYLREDVISEFYPLLLALNICYIPGIIIFGVTPHSRVIYADKIVQNTFYAILLHFVLFTAAMTFLKIDEVSRLFIISLYSILFLAINIWRLVIRFSIKLYRKKGFNFKLVVIIGAGKNGNSLYEEMMDDPGYGFRILGFFEDNPVKIPSDSKWLGSTNDIEAFLLKNEVDEVYCTLPESAEKTIVRTLNFCENNMIRFYIVPEFRRYVKKQMELSVLGNMPVLSLREEPLQHPMNRFTKRAFDIIFSLTFICTLFPVIYIIVAICVKISSPGPIFFKQRRTGERGREFYCYKFRSMKVNKEADTLQATKNDPRNTHIGELLRKSNIDEVPQIINVLKGEMSIVGPRPHMLKHTKQYNELIDKYMLRHLVKPGITGWAQVTGYRGETKKLSQMEGRVMRDVWYIEHWTFFLDIKIISLTIINMFRGEKNAY
ncbi:undecaprenyl-phosphate glucose phosphotransferase [uncultured Bacteroides sp.]|uniref:undecaprenyl-phosphate glucose phosphotransferase n=1 Tax=uncultured Bacteroides sp. TaxID=162156 RepID=UPI002AABED80|nr:undecaprenyl-phosphate glucose phosphotransferase [uncultured Bacteroides sp.]